MKKIKRVDFKNESSVVKTSLFIASFFILALLFYFFYSTTGKAIVEVENLYYSEGIVQGLVKFNIKQGELIPTDSIVRISMGNNTQDYLFSDLTNIQPIEGNFYAEDSALSGYGKGYGSLGIKTTYPVLSFDLRVKEKIISSSNSENNIEENLSNDSSEAQQENENLEESVNSEEQNVEEPVETAIEDNQQSETENIEETSIDSEEDSSSDQSNEPSSENQPAEESSSNEVSESPITGAVVSDLNSEEGLIVSGQVSYNQDFIFLLEDNQDVSLVKGSIKNKENSVSDNSLKLTKEGNRVVVSTNYKIEETGFGKDYVGGIAETVKLNLYLSEIENPEEYIDVELVYDNFTLAKARAKVIVNQSTLSQQEVSIEKAELEFLKEIPNYRIKSEENLILNLDEYFLGAKSYAVVVSNFDVVLNNNLLTLSPNEGFKGLRKIKIVAYTDNNLLESNEFEIFVSSSNINVSTKRSDVVLGQQVKWQKNISLEEAEEMKVQLPSIAENISVKKLDESAEEFVEIEEPSLLFTGEVVIEISPKKDNLFVRTWKVIAKSLRSITGNVVYSDEVIEVVLQENSTDYVIEYYTEGPTATEYLLEEGKQVVIYAPSELNYTDVLSFTTISEVLRVGQENRVKLYWEEEAEYLPFDVYDLDENGYLDYIEWITPHLSEQTFTISFSNEVLVYECPYTFIDGSGINEGLIESDTRYILENDLTVNANDYFCFVNYIEEVFNTEIDLNGYSINYNNDDCVGQCWDRIAFYFSGENNTIKNGNIYGFSQQDSGAFIISGASLEDLNITNNYWGISSGDFNNLSLKNLVVKENTVNFLGSGNLSLKKINSFGEINFKSFEYSSISYLDFQNESILQIGRGYAFVNSDLQPGLNVPANITFNVSSFSGNNFSVLRDGEQCLVNSCFNWIDSNSSDNIISFNVSSWSNYSVFALADVGESCSSGNECQSGRCDPFNFVCIDGSLGDFCDSHEQCQSGYCAEDPEISTLYSVCQSNFWFAGGLGTSDDPFQISTCQQLQKINTNLTAYYVLNNTIDCSDTIIWNMGQGFEPIGNISSGSYSFRGNLNGQGYSINNLYLNRPNTNQVGLIGASTTANFSNLSLLGSTIIGADYVGALSGFSTGDHINKIYVTGSVNGASYVGGLVGLTESDNDRTAIINNSFSDLNITGNNYVGGIAGYNIDEGWIYNSISVGNVSGSNIGGIVGQGISVLVSNSFYNSQTSGTVTNSIGTPKTTQELKTTIQSFEGWDFENVWGINETDSYPFLFNPGVNKKQIDSCQNFSNSGYYELASNISFTTGTCLLFNNSYFDVDLNGKIISGSLNSSQESLIGIKVIDSQNLVLSNGKITGSYKPIVLSNVNNSQIYEIEFINSSAYTMLENSFNISVFSNRFFNSSILLVGKDGLYEGEPIESGHLVFNNNFTGASNLHPSCLQLYDNIANVTVKNNHINNCYTGLTLDRGHNSIIDNNIINNSLSVGIRVVYAMYLMNNTMLNNKIINSGEYAIFTEMIGDEYLNFLVYNNSFGEMLFYFNGSIVGNLSLGDSINISNENAFVNFSKVQGLNISSKLTFFSNNSSSYYNPTLYNENKVRANTSLINQTNDRLILSLSSWPDSNLSVGGYEEIPLGVGWNAVSFVLDDLIEGETNVSVSLGWNLIGAVSVNNTSIANLGFIANDPCSGKSIGEQCSDGSYVAGYEKYMSSGSYVNNTSSLIVVSKQDAVSGNSGSFASGLCSSLSENHNWLLPTYVDYQVVRDYLHLPGILTFNTGGYPYWARNQLTFDFNTGTTSGTHLYSLAHATCVRYVSADGSARVNSSSITLSRTETLQQNKIQKRLASLNAQNKRYDIVSESSVDDDNALRVGRGYWLYANSSGNLSVPGRVSQGTKSLALSEVVFKNLTSGEEKNLSSAVSDGWVGSPGNLSNVFWKSNNNGVGVITWRNIFDDQSEDCLDNPFQEICEQIKTDKSYFVWSHKPNIAVVRKG